MSTLPLVFEAYQLSGKGQVPPPAAIVQELAEIELVEAEVVVVTVTVTLLVIGDPPALEQVTE